MRKLGIGNDDFKKEEKLKKSGNILPQVQDFQSYPQSETKKFYQEEPPRNVNPMGFTENFTYTPNRIMQNSFQSPPRPQHQGIIEVNAPKRMLMPADNMMVDERNSHGFSDIKNLENCI